MLYTWGRCGKAEPVTHYGPHRPMKKKSSERK